MKRCWMLLLLLAPLAGYAEPGIPALTVETSAEGAQSYSLTIQVLGIMTILTLLPAALLTMTSFTRIIIVLAILRQALGTPQSPPNQVLLGLALFLTMFIMAPVFETAYNGMFAFSVDAMPIIGESLHARGFWSANASWLTHGAGV